jgi:nitrogen-specific signal transduction histidine kinase
MTSNGWSGAVALEHFNTEIRGAVNALLGLTDLLLDTPLDATQREYVDVLRSTADRLLTIGGDATLMGGARPRPHSFVHVDLRETVSQVADLANALSSSRRLAVMADLGTGLEAPLLADRQYIEQALMSVVKACTSVSIMETLHIGAQRPDDEHVRFNVRAASSVDAAALNQELMLGLRAAERHVDALTVEERPDGLAVSFSAPVRTTV